MPAGWPEGYQIKRMAQQRVQEAKASGIDLAPDDAVLQIIGEILAGAGLKGTSPQEALTSAVSPPGAGMPPQVGAAHSSAAQGQHLSQPVGTGTPLPPTGRPPTQPY
jgi:hypothetical protein